MAVNISNKRIQIDKAQATIVAAVAIAVFVTVFSLIASRAYLSQRSFQARVIKEKKAALDQLEKNIDAVDSLKVKFAAFTNKNPNLIGGDMNGEGDRAGDNARIILDALPSKYDFPALITSVDKMVTNGGYFVDNIRGDDKELEQGKDAKETGPVEMPFELAIAGSYESIKQFFDITERSIRPIAIRNITISASSSSNSATPQVKLAIKALTYYQPGITFDITTKDVK